MNLDSLFNPKSIVIIGASSEKGKVGNVIAENILNLGYQGKVFLVNPKRKNILGQKCYGDISEIKEEINLAIVAIPAKFVNEIIEKSSNKVKNFVVISAGFSEIGAEGKNREDELQKIAEEKNLNILGPNCLGFIDPKIKLNASFAGGIPKDGNICFISQSGALAVALMDIAQKEDLGFSKIVSVGNKMQLDENDLLEYFGKDESVKVIGLYLEGIKNGKDFMTKAQEISKTKPIVILKAGKTEKSQEAIVSHTGALAGSNEIMKVAFEKAGIITAEDLEDFFKLLEFFSLTKFFEREQVAILTNAGGPGVLATDAFDRKEIKLAEIDEGIKESLRKILPSESSLQNPIDLLGDAREERYEKTLNEIEKQKNIGAVIAILTPQEQTPVEKIAEKLIVSGKNNKEIQLLTSFIGGNRIEKAVALLKKNNIPNFSFPEQAVETLEKYLKWKKWKEYFSERKKTFAKDEKRIMTIEAVIEKAKREGRTALLFSESSEIMKRYDVNTVKFLAADSKEKIQFPVVIKVDSDKVVHKTDRKGLILEIKDQKELTKSIQEMQRNFPRENIIIESMLPRQVELIIGIKKDPTFGPVVVYGLGGIYTEIFQMVNFLILPNDAGEVKKSLMKSKIGFLFEGIRGQNPYDAENVAKILWNIWVFANEAEGVKEFDINPFLIYNDGRDGVAVDVKIII
jgi:acetyltransferase